MLKRLRTVIFGKHRLDEFRFGVRIPFTISPVLVCKPLLEFVVVFCDFAMRSQVVAKQYVLIEERTRILNQVQMEARG